MNAQERIGFTTGMLERVIGFTRVADAKSAPLLALHLALAGASLANSSNIQLVYTDDALLERIVFTMFALTYFITSVLAWSFAALVYIPKRDPTMSSVIYFEDIGRMDEEEFRKLYQSLDVKALESQVLAQIHIVSRIASRKFDHVARSFHFSIVAIPSWAFMLLWAGW